MNCPEVLTNGPPLFPVSIAASVTTESASRFETIPTDTEPSNPYGAPNATTVSPRAGFVGEGLNVLTAPIV